MNEPRADQLSLSFWQRGFLFRQLTEVVSNGICTETVWRQLRLVNLSAEVATNQTTVVTVERFALS